MVGAEGGVASQRPNGSIAILAGGDSQFRCSHHGESGNYGDYPRGHAVCTGPNPWFARHNDRRLAERSRLLIPIGGPDPAHTG